MSHKKRIGTSAVARTALLVITSLFLTSIFFMPQGIAISETSRSSSYVDQSNISANASLAYDTSEATFATIGNATGNLTYASFDERGHNASVDVKRVDLLFDIETNLTDDEWGISYSYDGGASWQQLRALAGGNLSRTTLTYSDVAGPPRKWDWPAIATNLSVRILYSVNNSPDGLGAIELFGTWANVTSDLEGPNVTPLSPAENTNYSGLTFVNFTYNASDELSALRNCSLLIDGSINATDTSPSNVSTNIFNVTLDNGRYNWSIRCWDNATTPNANATANRTLTVDNAPPAMTLLSPVDGSTQQGGRIVTFTFRHDDLSALSNCSLFINNTLNATLSGDDANWPTGTGQFLVSLLNGLWSWNVSCTDIYGRSNISLASSFTQSANDPPSVTNISVPSTITPVMGGNATVECNATITDQQGQLTIANVTAYLHRQDWAWNHADESSGHLQSVNCVSVGINATSIAYQCDFSVPYYARRMNWTCTYHAIDTKGAEGFGTNTTFVEPLYAFNLTPAAIDYGAIQAGNVSSSDKAVVVTNLGNTRIDMALDGFAQSEGDGLAMVCDVGNTTVENERYDLAQGSAFASMTQLRANAIQLDSFDLEPKNDSFSGQRAIYWKLKLGVPQKGNCTGFVTFTALQS